LHGGNLITWKSKRQNVGAQPCTGTEL